MPIPALLVLLATAAQAPGTLPPPPPTRHWGREFVSPMGEPFRAERGGDALADWFNRADANHDGYLTVDEMQADAARFFAQLDVNHDGEIDPDEITRYESVIAPEISSGPHFDMAMGGADGGQHGGGRPHGGGGGHHRGGGFGGGNFAGRPGDEHQGAARFGLLDLPEPVASADSNFNRGVSLEEFRQAAKQRFVALDIDHQGRLTLAGLELIRPAPPPEPHKADDSSSSADVPPGSD